MLLGTIMYLPVLVYLVTTDHKFFFLEHTAYITQAWQFIPRFLENISILFAGIVASSLPSPIKFAAYMFVVLCALKYSIFTKHPAHRVYSAILTVSILFPLVMASFLKSSEYYQFVAITGPFIILVSEIVVFSFRNKKYSTITLVCIMAFLALTVIDLPYLRHIFTRKSIQIELEQAADTMIPAFTHMQTIYGNTWPEKFKIRTYNGNRSYNFSDAIFWSLLEQKTNTKLTKLSLNDTTWGHNYIPLGADDSFVIVICTDYESLLDAQRRCIPKFLSDYPHHIVEKLLSNSNEGGSYIIYLARRSTI